MFSLSSFAGRLRHPALGRQHLVASARSFASGAAATKPAAPATAALPRRSPALPRPRPAPRLTPLAPVASLPPQAIPGRSAAWFSSTARRRLLDPRDPRVQAMMRNSKPLISGAQAKRAAKSPSMHGVVLLAIAGGLYFYFHNIETVPVSGRQRFNCFSDKWARRASENEYKQLLAEFKYNNIHMLPEWDWRVRAVRRVMAKLIPVSGMDEASWEIFVIDDPDTANAFVLPNGKVFVHSGLFRYARNDDALAVVLGHEIAHNLAGHVSERLSQGIGTNLVYWGVMLLAYATGAIIFFEALGGGRLLRGVLENPMSRMQESEADQIGLVMMAEACYRPDEALLFWGRMQEQQVPEWLSTHPSNESRIENLRKWMPMAEDKRAQSDCHGTQGFADAFKKAMQRGEIIAFLQ